MSGPQVPSLPKSIDPKVRQSIEAIVQYLKGDGGYESSEFRAAVAAIAGNTVADNNIDYPNPLAPSGLTAAGSFSSIILSWTGVSYQNGFAYHEIHRAETDNLSNAVLVGTTTADVYTDVPSNQSLSTTYYYWVRAINQKGYSGPFNASAGTSATLADDPSYVLELAVTQKWRASAPYEADFVIIPSNASGYAYTSQGAGTSGATEPDWTTATTVGATIVDNDITWECVADDVSLSSFLKVAYVNGGYKPVTDNILIGEATIESAMIQDAAIDTAKIADAAITTAKIGSLSADKITTGTLDSITVKSTSPSDQNTYALLDDGDLTFYKGGKAYKYLKQIYTGTAVSGTTVTLDNLDRAPKVIVSLRDLTAYDASVPAQTQRWEVRLNDSGVVKTGDGSYSFTPIANLTYGGTTASAAHNYTPSGASSNTQYAPASAPTSFYTTPANTTDITITGNVNSVSGSGVSGGYNVYQTRKCQIDLYYRVSGGGGWSGPATTTVQHSTDLTEDVYTLTASGLVANTYDYYVSYTFSDSTGGTFQDGVAGYTTGSQLVGPVWTTAVTVNATGLYGTNGSTAGSVQWSSATANLGSASLPAGAVITSVDYSADISHYTQGGYSGQLFVNGYGGVLWNVHNSTRWSASATGSYSSQTTQTNSSGGVFSTKTYSNSSGTFDNTLVFSAGENYYGNAQISAKNVKATINYREYNDNTYETNYIELLTAAYTLSGATVLDNTGVVNYIAIA